MIRTVSNPLLKEPGREARADGSPFLGKKPFIR
jgi:hypothetical protein